MSSTKRQREKSRKMFKSKADSGRNNLCGEAIKRLRKATLPKMSQRMLAEKLQLYGIVVDKNAIQRIDCGARFITDIELLAISKVFEVSIDSLFYSE